MLTLHRPMEPSTSRDHWIGPAPWITTPPPGPMTLWAVARDRRVTCSSSTRPYPLVVRRARGTIVEDLDENRYLDFTAGTAGCPTGHCHPHVVQAIERQAHYLADPCGQDLDCNPMITLARKLAHIAPGDAPKRVLLTNSATESVEAAIKLSRDHTHRNRIIAFVGAAHNRTLGLLSLTACRSGRRRMASSAPTVAYLRYGNVAAVRERISGRRAGGDDVAAILVEPILGQAGYVVPPSEFLPELRSLCDEHGILLIADEIQTGMGRTGKMFCCEHHAVVPDILLAAYGVASGMPICAVVAPETIMEPNWGWPGPTFSGNPISCAAAVATIELLEEGKIANAAKMFPIAMGKLERIAHRHGCISSPRGLGLMLAVDVVKPRRSKLSAAGLRDRLITEAFGRGLLLLGSGERSIRFTPPLCVNRVQLEVGLDVFEEAVATVSA